MVVVLGLEQEHVDAGLSPPCCSGRNENAWHRNEIARHYRRARARSRKRIASAWCRIVGEDVPSSSVRSETSPIAACCPRAIAASSPDAYGVDTRSTASRDGHQLNGVDATRRGTSSTTLTRPTAIDAKARGRRDAPRRYA